MIEQHLVVTSILLYVEVKRVGRVVQNSGVVEDIESIIKVSVFIEGWNPHDVIVEKRLRIGVDIT